MEYHTALREERDMIARVAATGIARAEIAFVLGRHPALRRRCGARQGLRRCLSRRAGAQLRVARRALPAGAVQFDAQQLQWSTSWCSKSGAAEQIRATEGASPVQHQPRDNLPGASHATAVAGANLWRSLRVMPKFGRQAYGAGTHAACCRASVTSASAARVEPRLVLGHWERRTVMGFGPAPLRADLDRSGPLG